MQLQLKSKFIWCFFLLFTKLTAQQFPSTHFTIRDGLPSNSVYCVFKDSRGLIWIGTDAGLVKYDGFHFKTLTNKNGLAGNFIRDIKEDKTGNLWIACYGDGLTRFDGKQFVNFSKKDGLIHNEIRCLYFDKNQNLCIGTERGLSIWNGKWFINFLTKSFDVYNRFQVMQFWEERNKLFFLSRTHGYYQVNFDGNKIKCDSLGKSYSQILFIRLKNEKLYSHTGGLFSDKTKDHFPISFKNNLNISEDIVWDYEKIGNSVYLASNCIFCNQGGLMKYENGLLHNISANYKIDSKQLWSLFFDKKHSKLWVSSLDKGCYVLDLRPKIMHFNFKELNMSFKLPINFIASKTSFYLKTSNLELHQKDFIDYAKASNRQFVTIKKSTTYNLSKFSFFVNRPFEIRSWKETNKCVYVATNIGFFELSKRGTFISYFPVETNLFQVRRNDIILYIPNGKFVKLKKVKNKWHFFELDTEKKNQPKIIVEMIHFRNKTFFASSLYGLYSMKDNQNLLKHYREPLLKDLKIKGICSDGGKTLFLATNNNEILAFKENQERDRLLYKYKLDSDDFVGESILNFKFSKNILMILTNRGLNLINGQKHIFINEEQGLNLSTVTNVFIENDKLFIGNSLGYYQIHFSDYFESISEKPIVSLEKIQISGNQTYFNESLNLDYFENNLDLYLKKVKLYDVRKVELTYSLNKKNWSKIYGNAINLRELASGNYQLFVRQKNYFSGNTLVYPIMKIYIASPFWKTGWFIVLMAIVFVAIVYLIYQLNIKRIKVREKQKAELLKRIAESKLEALQSQMNPHFIFNSLTAIHSYIIKSDVDNALLYMDKFAKLTRQTLEFSSRTQIPLLEELEYLSHFIAMENMRFGNRVKVNIDVCEIDTLKVVVPPLLIQPLIENAFEHGFTNRDKNYSLELTFEIEQEQLQIIISDDGEGFSSNEANPESKAINIIRERLQLIDPKLVEFFTLAREDNRTVVRFVLPLISH